MNKYDYFIAYIVLNKILFVLFGVWHFLLVRKNVGETELSYKLNVWKEYFEFMFVISMALLCLYLFNPVVDVRPAINYETRVLLFVAGLSLLTANGICFSVSLSGFCCCNTLLAGIVV